VKIGIGTKKHGGALMTAGAEKVFWLPDEHDLIVDHAGASIREGDVVLLVDPSLLKLTEYHHIQEACLGDLQWAVVGHEPRRLATNMDIKEFKKLTPEGRETPITQSGGRPSKFQCTVEQADAIIRLWHEKPKRKPEEIVRLADVILGVPDGTVQKHWVRDLVRKHVGTAQRDKPEGWRGVRID